MKLFAITPDHMSPGLLHRCMPRLRTAGASYLYLRSASLQRDLYALAAAAAEAGMMPIVPYRQYCADMPGPCGAHFKSSELGGLPRCAPPGAAVITASGHCSSDATLALQAGAGFVFVSPVFAPLSKPSDSRRPFDRTELQQLVTRHGEKIVLLGGMTPARIASLEKEITGAFSAAGISLFFSDACGTGPQ